jgi:hypothetical protein
MQQSSLKGVAAVTLYESKGSCIPAARTLLVMVTFVLGVVSVHLSAFGAVRRDPLLSIHQCDTVQESEFPCVDRDPLDFWGCPGGVYCLARFVSRAFALLVPILVALEAPGIVPAVSFFLGSSIRTGNSVGPLALGSMAVMMGE